jgi:tRNA threonylcarbamoyladenosine biosynthesis protein TsaE
VNGRSAVARPAGPPRPGDGGEGGSGDGAGDDAAAAVAEVRSGGPDDTRLVAGALAEVVRPGDIVVLAGDLGAGKTTFTQGLAAALGVDEPVTSPTFALVRPYRCDGRHGVVTLLHADVYRLDRLAEVADLGLTQLVEDAAVAVVEWGDRALPVLGTDTLTVRIEAGADDDERRLVVVADGPSWTDRRDALQQALASLELGTAPSGTGPSGTGPPGSGPSGTALAATDRAVPREDGR